MKGYLSIFLLCISPLLWGQENFRSNALGMPLEKIEANRVDEFPYILTISDEQKEERTLYYEGREIKRWVNIFSEEGEEHVYYEYGEKEHTELYKNGKLIREYTYREGIIKQKKVYHYNNEGLYAVDVFGYGETEDEETNGEERFLYREQYSRTSSGGLRRYQRIYPDSFEDRTVSVNVKNGRLIEETIRQGASMRLLQYDQEGAVQYEAVWQLGELISETVYEEMEPGRLLKIKDYYTGELIEREYDMKDRLVREKILFSTGAQEETFLSYREDLLVHEIRRSPGKKEVWQYRYGESSELLTIEYLVNNELKKRTFYLPEEGSRREILYRDGDPLIQIDFENGSEISRTVLSRSEEDTSEGDNEENDS